MPNPDWVRDELILALDVYFTLRDRQMSAQHPEIVALSNILNVLPIHREHLKDSKFRNPAGVHMKLRNFHRLDPTYDGQGLGNGGKLDQAVWEEFSTDVPKLRRIASAIRHNYRLLDSFPDDVEMWAQEEEFLEGRLLTRLHLIRERNPTVVKRKKEAVMQAEGKLSCQACAFDFCEVYGDLGAGFAECHHMIPVSLLEPNHPTKLQDLAIVCANCHRMLHRGGTLLTVTELRTILEARKYFSISK